MDPLNFRMLIKAMWFAWFIYWFVAARSAKTTERRESIGSLLLHMGPLVAAFWLLGGRPFLVESPFALLDQRLLPRTYLGAWIGTLITAAGLLFAVWARVHIGRNWSGHVTIKQEHELIVSGPYALVRHPIYTGLLLALIGSTVARGEWRGVVAVALAWVSLWRKLLLEEQWMVERFGDQYLDYRRRVPALVPG